MENQIVEAINYIKKISKKKPSIYRLLAPINNTTANDWDRQFAEGTLYELRAKGIMDDHFKILSTDNAITSASDEMVPLPGHPLTPILPNQIRHKRKPPLFHPFLVSNQ